MSTQSDFISKIAPIIQKIGPAYGIKCNSAVIAQACLESAYGTSNKAKHHNYFGLKYRPGRLTCNNGTFVDGSSEQRADGSRYNITDQWYNFDSMAKGVEGYFQFIGIPNYGNLVGVTDPEKYLTNIRADKYATSLDYVKNNMAVVEKWNLRQYDQATDKECNNMVIVPNTGFKGFNVSKRTAAIKFIVIHYVGAAGTAKNNVSYFNGGNRHASADFFVDEANICQYNPDIAGQYSWHCGGGLQSSSGHTYYGICTNGNSIGIELCCYQDSTGWHFKDETVENAVALVKHLMQTYNVPAGNVIRHYDVTGKYCPGIDGWIPVIGGKTETAWKDFKARLTATQTNTQAATQTGSNQPTAAQDTTGGMYMFNVATIKRGSKGNDVKLLQTLLKAAGCKGADNKALAIDGDAGSNTEAAIKKYQKKKKLTVDGEAGPVTWAAILLR